MSTTIMKIFLSAVVLISLPIVGSQIVEMHPCLTVAQAFGIAAVAAKYQNNQTEFELDCSEKAERWKNTVGCCRTTTGQAIEYDEGGEKQDFRWSQVRFFSLSLSLSFLSESLFFSAFSGWYHVPVLSIIIVDIVLAKCVCADQPSSFLLSDFLSTTYHW